MNFLLSRIHMCMNENGWSVKSIVIAPWDSWREAGSSQWSVALCLAGLAACKHGLETLMSWDVKLDVLHYGWIRGRFSFWNAPKVVQLFVCVYKMFFIAGVSVKDRYRELLQVTQPHTEDHTLLFNDLHFLMVSLGSKETATTQRLLESLQELAKWAANITLPTQEITLQPGSAHGWEFVEAELWMNVTCLQAPCEIS